MVSLAVRNNNPGNLEFAEWERGFGATGRGKGGRFANFSSPEGGLAAIVHRQTQIQRSGAQSITQRVLTWLGGDSKKNPENSPASVKNYIAAIAREMGIDPNTPFDIRDPQLGPKFLKGMASFESGYPAYTDAQIQAGFKRGLAGLGPVPPMDIPNPTSRTLRKGMSGPAVRELQSQLAAAGLYKGKIDGIYGRQTEKAVRAAETQYGLNVDRGIAGPQVQTALRNQGSVDNIASVLGFGSPNDTTTQPMSPTDIAFGRPVDLGEPSARFGVGAGPANIGAGPGGFDPYGRSPLPPPMGYTPPLPSTFPARPERQFSNLAPARYDMPPSGVARGAPFPSPPMSFAANDIPLPRPRPSTVTMTGSAAGGLGRDVAMGAGSTASDKWQPLSLAPPPPENDPSIGLTGSAEGGLGRGVNMGAGYDTPGASWASMKGPAAGTDVLSGMKTSTPFEAPGTSINDVLKGWFGGEEPVAAKPSLMDTMPPAVPPGGFPGGDTFSIDDATEPVGRAGADRFDVAFGPAGGESALNKNIPGVTFGDLPAHIPGGFGASPAAMPTPRQIQSAPQQQDGRDYFSPTGRPSNGQSYASLGGGGGPGGFNVASNSYAPWAGGAPYAGYMGGGFQGPNGFSNSPFTPGGYTAPDFNPISGGSTYAINKNDRTYVTSDGMGGYRVQSYQ